MQRHAHLFLNGTLVVLGFTAFIASAQAQTVLDRDNNATASDRSYLEVTGLEGPTPLQHATLLHLSGECATECPAQTGGIHVSEGRVSARNIGDLKSAAPSSETATKTSLP
ncbi:hypothetical protein [Dyella caseinilytica]|uniref:Uncharacterized protein n=1 Tax=Dyella caseinilytica TaxID=1849581 RepID=A0ABX7GYN4_9GAMM|nr:hypothetical protein [Dyella caseinilytica]QRN55517.1 hypothetical protein ISN74_09435 [Dyella caseinilytica]GGA02358.1 hypothetical protein GCM10011408_24710 [Dyella caseinilytica]